ncbi:unnamed protein product [Prunus armeniaca]|uniref:Uncharacterized protein n=1 Tax=Prunus armeniaca TaxID=36596 RepID=A0A6J5XHB8_PRUAR|nr:unnamed protein product [Prunus armeniaca]
MKSSPKHQFMEHVVFGFVCAIAKPTSLSLILSDRGSVCADPLCAKPHLRQTSLSTAPLSSNASLSLHFSLSRHLSQLPLSQETSRGIVPIARTIQQFCSISCRLVGNFWSSLHIPAVILPLSEVFQQQFCYFM